MRPRCFVCCIPIPLLLTGIAVGLVAAIRHARGSPAARGGAARGGPASPRAPGPARDRAARREGWARAESLTAR